MIFLFDEKNASTYNNESEEEKDRKEMFLKYISIVSANGYGIDVYKLANSIQELKEDLLLQKSVEWIRGLHCTPETFMESVCKVDMRGVVNSIEAGVNVNHMDSHGRTALGVIVKYDTNESNNIMKYLLLNNADVNVCDFKGTSILQRAIKYNNISAVQLLVDHNAVVKKSHMQYARKKGFSEITEILWFRL